ncbi:MAG: MerR family transcriptional regulator [Rhodoferax sp.]|nr:MerR family transcriptional regulator [Rhodoferax sp.]
MNTPTFSLDELATLAGLPRRTVRYYIQQGLVARPVGETRGAYYLPSHLDALLRVRQLTEAGISLERVREVLQGSAPAVPPRARQPGSVEVRSHIWVAPGLELQISPEQARASPEDIRKLAQAVVAAWQLIQEEKDEK